MDRQTREGIDRHIEGPSWAGESDDEEVDGGEPEFGPSYDKDGKDRHMKVVKSISFRFDGSMTLADLENIVATGQKVTNNKARVTIRLIPEDRPGSLSSTEIRITEA